VTARPRLTSEVNRKKRVIHRLVNYTHVPGVLYKVKNNTLCGDHVRPSVCDVDHPFCSLSFEWSIASSKVSSPQGAV
jgi:hypothetical protein